MQMVSKSQLKLQLLEYLRKIERDKKPLVITHVGKPVLKISPYKEDPLQVLKTLRDSVTAYEAYDQPVGESGWEILK